MVRLRMIMTYDYYKWSVLFFSQIAQLFQMISFTNIEN